MRPCQTLRALVLIVFSGVAGLSGPDRPALAAGTSPIDTALETCLEQNQTTAGMAQCLDQAFTAWDGELNAAYKAVMAGLPPEAKTALRTAQRDWVAFKDAQIASFRSMLAPQDGTIWPLVASRYAIDLVRKRAVELRCFAIMSDMEGPADPYCP